MNCGKQEDCRAKMKRDASEEEPVIEPEEVATPTLGYHEYASIFPMMTTEEFDNLIEDIRENGLREPITIHEGKIVDGRNRYQACLKLGIEPTTVPWEPKGDLLGFVVSRNLHRRHLDESQRAVVAAKLMPMFEQAAKEHQRKRIGIQPAVSAHDDPESTGIRVADLPHWECGKSRDAAAKAMNVSPRLVQGASTIIKTGNRELVEALETGKVKVTRAEKIARLPREEQPKAIEENRTKSKKKPPAKGNGDNYPSAFRAYEAAIEEAKRQDWETVSRDAIFKDLEALMSILGIPAQKLAA